MTSSKGAGPNPAPDRLGEVFSAFSFIVLAVFSLAMGFMQFESASHAQAQDSAMRVWLVGYEHVRGETRINAHCTSAGDIIYEDQSGGGMASTPLFVVHNSDYCAHHQREIKQ